MTIQQRAQRARERLAENFVRAVIARGDDPVVRCDLHGLACGLRATVAHHHVRVVQNVPMPDSRTGERSYFRRFCSMDALHAWRLRGGDDLPDIETPIQRQNYACHHCLAPFGVNEEQVLIATGDYLRFAHAKGEDHVRVIDRALADALGDEEAQRRATIVRVPSVGRAGDCDRCENTRVIAREWAFVYASPEDPDWEPRWAGLAALDHELIVNEFELAPGVQYLDKQRWDAESVRRLLVERCVYQRCVDSPRHLKAWWARALTADQLEEERAAWRRERDEGLARGDLAEHYGEGADAVIAARAA